ncbi:hypothetical protein BLNAU_6217 [Blattamonas nauphoetae]|uniref:Uncharacterized protein n=1 Tax=Blattamonas nauphoetae TaxID=2049346 RepID=A0ABQ9Y4S5_9EUKA|nr:hypothetical protein BLNAU_6217 [Blattamonas nauphoetae]
MLPDNQQNISKSDDKDEMNHPTIESVLEWLSDSSVHPRNKVNSFQWFHIPTLLTTHIQSQPKKQNNELLSQLLQRMMTILDECFDSQTPIANKRLLHSSLSQLSQSPSLPPTIQRDMEKCFASLKFVEEGQFVLVEKDTLDSLEMKEHTIEEQKQQLDVQRQKLSESEKKKAQLEEEKAEWMEERKTHLSTIQSLQKENEQLRSELASKTQKLEENERVIEEQKQTIQQTKTEVARKEPIVASDVIFAFSPTHFRVSGSTVTQLIGGWTGCFTRAVSNGIHRLSIRNVATKVMIGVLDAMEFPKHLTTAVYTSPKAAMMYNNGCLWSACKQLARNTRPQPGQEWSAEADLEKRTLHFFIDGVQQKHHFINIPVPLVFALDVHSHGTQVEITFWGETQSHVTFEGTGHNLG